MMGEAVDRLVELSHVKAHIRHVGGKLVRVREYDNKVRKHVEYNQSKPEVPQDTPQQKAILRQSAIARKMRKKYPVGSRVVSVPGVGLAPRPDAQHGTVLRHVPGGSAQGGYFVVRWDNGVTGRINPASMALEEPEINRKVVWQQGDVPPKQHPVRDALVSWEREIAKVHAIAEPSIARSERDLTPAQQRLAQAQAALDALTPEQRRMLWEKAPGASNPRARAKQQVAFEKALKETLGDSYVPVSGQRYAEMLDPLNKYNEPEINQSKPWVAQERAAWQKIGIDPDSDIGRTLATSFQPGDEVSTPVSGLRHFYNPRNRNGVVFDSVGSHLDYFVEGRSIEIGDVEVSKDSRRQGRATALYDEMFRVHGVKPTTTTGITPEGSAFRAAYDERKSTPNAFTHDLTYVVKHGDGVDEPVTTRFIEVRDSKGSLVGSLYWKPDGTIGTVWVQKDFRRQGVATEMLRRAREVNPKVHHSTMLSPAGEAWAAVTRFEHALVQPHTHDDATPPAPAPTQASKQAVDFLPMTYLETDPKQVSEYAHDPRYVFQQKIDGTRGTLVIEGGKKPWFKSKSGGRLQNASASKVTQPLLDKMAVGSEGPTYYVDGELLDGYFNVFDMVIAGQEKMPYEQRLAIAEQWTKIVGIPNIRIIPTARTDEEKLALWEAVNKGGGEGVMIKRLDSPYVQGRDTKAHIVKAKIRSTADFVVTRTHVDGKENAYFGILQGGKVTELGSVSLLGKHVEVKAGDIIEIEYLYANPKDHHIVQPVLKRLRPDKLPEEATADQLRYVDKSVLDANLVKMAEPVDAESLVLELTKPWREELHPRRHGRFTRKFGFNAFRLPEGWHEVAPSTRLQYYTRGGDEVHERTEVLTAIAPRRGEHAGVIVTVRADVADRVPWDTLDHLDRLYPGRVKAVNFTQPFGTYYDPETGEMHERRGLYDAYAELLTDGGGVTKMGGHGDPSEIFIDVNILTGAYEDVRRQEEESGYSVHGARNLAEYVLVHEFGHAVDSYRNIHHGGLAVMGFGTHGEQAIGRDYVRYRRSEMEEAPSDYATQTVFELYAEMFASWWFHDPKTKREKRAQDLVEENASEEGWRNPRVDLAAADSVVIWLTDDFLNHEARVTVLKGS